MHKEVLALTGMHPAIQVEDESIKEIADKHNDLRDKLEEEFNNHFARISDYREWVNILAWLPNFQYKMVEIINTLSTQVSSINYKISVKENAILSEVIKDQFNYKSKEDRLIKIHGQKEVAKMRHLMEVLSSFITMYSELSKMVNSIIYLMKPRLEFEKELNPVK